MPDAIYVLLQVEALTSHMDSGVLSNQLLGKLTCGGVVHRHVLVTKGMGSHHAPQRQRFRAKAGTTQDQLPGTQTPPGHVRGATMHRTSWRFICILANH